MKQKLLTLTMFIGLGSFVQAQQAEKKGQFAFNGYADVNYFYNTNRPLSGSNTGVSGFARAFDQRANQFQLGLVQGKMTYTYDKTLLVTDMVFGPHADLGNYGNLVGPLGSTSSLAIKQAYITHGFNDKFSMTVGQFGTHVGYELIDAPENFNYSLSNLFNNGPFYHTGLKAEYAVSGKLTLMAGVVNNWDNLYDNNKYKSAIAQVKFVASDKLKMFLNYIGGNEETQVSFSTTDSLNSFKQLIDYVLNYQVTDKFYVGVNGVVGQASTTASSVNWGGAAMYVNYAFTKKFALGARADYFDNTQGVMYIRNTQVQSYTLTGKISLADGHLSVKPEVRFDLFGNNQFEDNDGNFSRNNQLTIGAAAVYKF